MKRILLTLALLLFAATASAHTPFFSSGSTPNSGGGGAITSFTLTTSNSGVQDFTIGQLFKDGDAPNPTNIITDALSSQVKCLNTFPASGACSFAAISGTYTSTANVASTIHVSTGAPPSGAAVSCPTTLSASANLGASGTVNFNGLTSYGSPISGVEMTRCLYRATSSGGVLCSAYADVYKDGRIFVIIPMDNGWVDIANSNKSYTATITIGGTNVINAQAISHAETTRWQAEGWIGTDPAVTPASNTPYIVSTKYSPNYFMDTPSAAALNGLTQSYTIESLGPWPSDQGAGGFQPQIGWLGLWDSLYITSLADSRAYNAVIAASKSMGAYSVVWRGNSDSANNQSWARPSIYPTCTFSACPNGSGGNPKDSGFTPNGSLWDYSHQGSAGYLCYAITARQDCYDMMAAQAVMVYLFNDPSHGVGVNRALESQERGVSWGLRTDSQYVALAQAGDLLAADIKSNIMATVNLLASGIGDNGLGIVYDYNMLTNSYPNYNYSAAANNGSGAVRLTVANLNGGNGTGGMVTGDIVLVNKDTGVDYSALWTITVVDTSHVDLQGSTFSGTGTGGVGTAVSPPWMLDWIPWSLGQILDMGIFTGSNLTTVTNVFNETAKLSVGRMGDGSAGTWCYDDFATYNMVVGTQATGGPSNLLTTLFSGGTAFGDAWTRSVNANVIPGGACTTTLRGGGSSGLVSGYQSYWGNSLGAIAEEYDHGVTGAVAGYNRLWGAANWSVMRNSTQNGGFADTPIFGIQHR